MAMALELLLNWNEKVKQMVPPEKLLIMDLKEGWEPLCTFLGVPVPDEPLPRANDAAAADKAANDIADKLFRIWLGVLFSATGITAFAVWKLRRS